jgi:hypothetical protein
MEMNITEITYPAVRYHPTGQTMLVREPLQDKALAEQGWGPTPFPPAPEPREIHRFDLRSQVQDLEERVRTLEGALVRGDTRFKKKVS